MESRAFPKVPKSLLLPSFEASRRVCSTRSQEAERSEEQPASFDQEVVLVPLCTSHWPEFSHMFTPSCKGDWELGPPSGLPCSLGIVS